MYDLIDGSPRRAHKALRATLAGGLSALPMVWLTSAVFGYTLMFKSLGASSWRSADDFAGSALFTLGFAKPDDLAKFTLSFTAVALTISILALLLVTHLPTIYSAYTHRETRLTSFETVAGDTPNVVGLLIRAHELTNLTRLSMLWDGWREWFAELRESHTALPAVAFLGSSREDRNWVSAGELRRCAAGDGEPHGEPHHATRRRRNLRHLNAVMFVTEIVTTIAGVTGENEADECAR